MGFRILNGDSYEGEIRFSAIIGLLYPKIL